MKTQLFLIIIAVILLAASVSQAALVFFDTDDPFVMPGETISVAIFSTEPTAGIRMDRISDDAGGLAGNLYLNPGYDWKDIFNKGTAVNTGGVLIESVRGGLGTTGSPTVSGVLYSFDYTVSEEVVLGQIISIFADSSGGYINEVDIVGMIDNVTPENLAVTVVPEPATIMLLSIGSFWLARKTRGRS